LFKSKLGPLKLARRAGILDDPGFCSVRKSPPFTGGALGSACHFVLLREIL